jgi:hypothetical protein
LRLPNGFELSGPAKSCSHFRAGLAGSALADPAFCAGQRVVRRQEKYPVRGAQCLHPRLCPQSLRMGPCQRPLVADAPGSSEKCLKSKLDEQAAPTSRGAWRCRPLNRIGKSTATRRTGRPMAVEIAALLTAAEKSSMRATRGHDPKARLRSDTTGSELHGRP